jgi:hypothetical protein
MHDLPDELVAKVIGNVRYAGALYNLALTSHRIYRITLPILYTRISHHLYQEPRRLHSAIRTLIRRPDLAAKIRSVAIRDPIQNDSYWDLKSWMIWAKANYNAVLGQDDQHMFLTAAYTLIGNHPLPDKIIGHEEAQAALLLALASDLKHLHLENPSLMDEPSRFGMDHLILDILDPNIREGKILQKLQKLTAVTARLEGGQGGFRLASIATFFQLPNLHSVTGVAGFEPEDPLFINFDRPERSSSVKEIKFLRSAICPLGLSQMIGACKSLEVFDSDWAGLSLGWVEINFPLLREALAEHKETLTILTLDTAKHYDSWPERDDGLVPPLGHELRLFEKLRKLDVPASALIGWDENDVGGYDPLKDTLPPNLEEMKINEYAPRLLEMILDFVPTCAELLPKLKKLTISRVHSGGADVEDNLEQKFKDFAPGVELTFEDAREIDHFEGSIGSGSI